MKHKPKMVIFHQTGCDAGQTTITKEVGVACAKKNLKTLIVDLNIECTDIYYRFKINLKLTLNDLEKDIKQKQKDNKEIKYTQEEFEKFIVKAKDNKSEINNLYILLPDENQIDDECFEFYYENFKIFIDILAHTDFDIILFDFQHDFGNKYSNLKEFDKKYWVFGQFDKEDFIFYQKCLKESNIHLDGFKFIITPKYYSFCLENNLQDIKQLSKEYNYPITNIIASMDERKINKCRITPYINKYPKSDFAKSINKIVEDILE